MNNLGHWRFRVRTRIWWAWRRLITRLSPLLQVFGAPRPLPLSPTQRDQVKRAIAAFVENDALLSGPAACRADAARYEVLPILFGWTGFMALRLDGQVVWKEDCIPGGPVIAQDDQWRVIALADGAKRYPELAFLTPVRPPDARTCPDCKGTGVIPLPPGLEHLAGSVRCRCGGLGWLVRPRR